MPRSSGTGIDRKLDAAVRRLADSGARQAGRAARSVLRTVGFFWRAATAPGRGRAAAAGVIAVLLGTGESARAGDHVDAGTLTGKLIMGYQGWFACPGDAAMLGWGHWGKWSGGHPAPVVDMLPDVSDLPPTARCNTQVQAVSGQPIQLFSSYDPGTVDVHFAWMQEYGLDGIALQRFGADIRNPIVRRARDIVLENVRNAAEHHGRVFFVMYDLSGMHAADLAAVAADWKHLELSGVTRSTAYLRHRGHPLLGVWGLGFKGRPIVPGDAAGLLDALETASAHAGGVTVLGGVPFYWRSRTADASPDPGWNAIWQRIGVISPWSVGRFRDDQGADQARRTTMVPDLKAARAFGADYMPVAFPGFSWANLIRAGEHPDRAIDNQIPRRCGRFYWRQVFDARSAGATMLYGAMFDEVNEGTAMFKILPNAVRLAPRELPPNTTFVALDADGCRLPSDWYLRLAGAATAALRSGAPPSPNLPLSLRAP